MTPPSDLSLRASDAEREHHAELLREHAAQGRLTLEELDERLDRVYAARTRGELAPVVADLPVPEPPPAPRPRSHRRGRRPDLLPFLLVNALLIVVWAATGAGYFWPIWPILGWGLGLLGPCGRPARSRRPPQASARS